MEGSGAVKVHVGQEAERLVNEVGRKRLLESRFVITRPDDETRRQSGELNARWCIRGYLDPDLLDLETAAPTLSLEGLSVALQLIASRKWKLNIADIEAAFLKGDAIQRKRGRVLAKLPEGGLPGLASNSIIELLKPVYGLADVPVAWFKSFSCVLLSFACVQSAMDPCVFMYFAPDLLETQGIIALHVDDMMLGGAEVFIKQVMELVRKKYPFKHFKVGSGEFLGRMVTQQEDFSIVVEQSDCASQIECIQISRDRRRQRESDVSEEER